jgi:hypothetical protein
MKAFRLLPLLTIVTVAAHVPQPAWNHSSPLQRHAVVNATSHFDLGAQIGAQMRPLIHRYFSTSPLVRSLGRFVRTPRGGALLEEFLRAHERSAFAAPLVDEVRGLAHGSGQPFDLVLAVNLQNELGFLMRRNRTLPRGRAAPRANGAAAVGCSDYHLQVGEDTSVWAHNEDGHAELRAASYMVQATLRLPGARPIAYVAFTYAAQLSGWAWGATSRGLALSVNALTPVVARSGVGVQFVARHVLGAEGIEDAARRAALPGGEARAGGQHFNLGCAKTGRQWSVETSPAIGASVQRLGPNVAGGRYAHMNQYLRAPLEPRIGDYESSVHRLARAAQISSGPSPPRTALDVLAVMGDAADPAYSIYRGNTSEDPYVTLVTALFDLSAGTLRAYDVRPWRGAAPALEIALSGDGLSLLSGTRAR